MALTRAAGFPVNSATNATTLACTWATAGDLALVAVYSTSGTGIITGVSSANTSGWQRLENGNMNDGLSFNVTMWGGVVNAAGADTVHVTYSATPSTYTLIIDAFNPGAGVSAVWYNGGLAYENHGGPTTTASWTMVTSSPSFNAPSQMYYGINKCSSAPVAGGTAGYTYTTVANNCQVVFNGSIGASQALTGPTGKQTTSSSQSNVSKLLVASTVQAATVSLAGSSGLAVTPVFPKAQTLTNDFSTALSPPWASGTSGGGTYSISGGQISMTCPAATSGAYMQVVPWTAANGFYYYDLTESYVVVQLVNAGTQDPGLEVWAPQLLDSVTWYGWHIINGQIQVDNAGTIVKSATYSSATYQWLRIREHAGTTYFDYSANGNIWTNFTSIPDTGTPNAVRPNLYIGNYSSTTNPAGTAIFDNYNLPPPATVTMRPAAALYVSPVYPKTATLTDDFSNPASGQPDQTKWITSYGGYIVNSGGQLVCTFPPGISNTFPSIYSGISAGSRNTYYDLTESYYLAQLINAGDAGSATGLCTFQLVQQDAWSNSAAQFYLYRGTLSAQTVPGPGQGAVTVWSAPWDAVNYQWMRVREHAGTIYFDTSADGNIWTNRGSSPDVFYTNAMQAFVDFGVQGGPTTAQTVFVLDNLNLPPSASIPLSATAGMSIAGTRVQVASAPLSGSSGMTVTPFLTGPKMQTLTDNFPVVGTPDITKWFRAANTPTDVQVTNNNLLQIITEANNTVYSQLHAGTQTTSNWGNDKCYDLTESYALVQLVTAGVQSLASLEIYPLYLSDESYTTLGTRNTLFWYLNTGGLYAFQVVNGTQTNLKEIAYSSTAHKWLRIREHAGTIYFDYSANGNVWTNFTSVPDVPDVTYLSPWIQCGTYNPEASGAGTTFATFNLPPPLGTNFTGVAGLTIAAKATYFAQVALAGSASLSPGAVIITQFLTAALSGSGSLTVAGTRGTFGAITLAGSASQTLGASVQQAAAVAQVVATSLTVVGIGYGQTSPVFSVNAVLTVAASVKEIATVALPGTSVLTIAAQLSITSTVTEAATAGMVVAGARVVLSSVSMAPTSTLTIGGLVLQQAAVVMASTTTLAAVPSVQQIAVAGLFGQASMTVATAPVWLGQAAMTGTAGMTVGAKLLISPSFGAAVTSSLTIGARVTEIAAVHDAATAGMTVTGAPLTVLSAAHLTGTTSLVVGAMVTISTATVAQSATARLTTASISQVSSTVMMPVTAQLTVVGQRVRVDSAALSASSNMIIAGQVHQFAAVSLAGASQLLVAGVPTRWDSVHLVGTATLAPTTTSTIHATVPLVGTGSLVVAGMRTGVASILLVGGTRMQIAGVRLELGQAIMAAHAGMTVTAATMTMTGQVAMAASTSMTVAGQSILFFLVAQSSLVVASRVQENATVPLVGNTTMVLLSDLTIADAVALIAVSTLYADSKAHGTSPFDWPDLEEMLASLVGVDPLMLGAQGTGDDVWPLRLLGPVQ